MRPVIATWRLSRAVLHLLHGLVIIKLRFGGYSHTQRESRIAWWSGKMLRVLGLELVVTGDLPPSSVRTLVVSNHVSWLDIAAIHSVVPQARFVSRADVLKWPVIGSLVAGAGTLFIERERKRDALRVVRDVSQALHAGQTVAVFPEAQVSDGHGLLPFHANLFQAATSTGATVLPLCLRFCDADQKTSAVTNYTGDTTLLQSAWRVTCARKLVVRVRVLGAIDVEGLDRREVAAVSRAAIHEALHLRD